MKYIIFFFFCLIIYNQGYWVLPKKTPIKISNTSKDYKDVILYLINLDRAKDRLNYMMPKISKLNLPFQRISATDGKEIPEKEIKEKFDLETYHQLRGNYGPIGAFGCTLSHIETWKTFLNSNYEYALIIEDDADFDPILLSQAISQLISNPQYWDINTFDPKLHGMPLTIAKFQNNNLVIYLTHVLNTTAYIISRKAAEKLLSRAFPIIMPIDRYFSRAWEFDLKFTGISPQLVSQNFGDSQILATKGITRPILKVSKLIYFKGRFTSQLYKIQTAIIRLLYNLKLFFLIQSYKN